jgi:hypothetical protein
MFGFELLKVGWRKLKLLNHLVGYNQFRSHVVKQETLMLSIDSTVLYQLKVSISIFNNESHTGMVSGY